MVLATGARWVGDGLGATGPDPMPGADGRACLFVTPEQFFAGKPIGERVVILDADGYFMAISIAERLADQGKQVTMVTQLEKVAPMTDLTLEGFNLKRMMREKGIHERVGHWVERAAPRGQPGGGRGLRSLSRRLAAHRRADQRGLSAPARQRGRDPELRHGDPVHRAGIAHRALRFALRAPRRNGREKGIEVIVRAGDCLAPRYLADAIFDGHRIAREFESADPERPKAMIRERQIWGQEVYPKLGDPVL